MQTIFIMVKCERGRAYEVADAAVQNVEQVSEVHSISGQYDLLMKVYLDDQTDIGRLRHQSRADAGRSAGHVHPDRIQGVHLRSQRRLLR